MFCSCFEVDNDSKDTGNANAAVVIVGQLQLPWSTAVVQFNRL